MTVPIAFAPDTVKAGIVGWIAGHCPAHVAMEALSAPELQDVIASCHVVAFAQRAVRVRHPEAAHLESLRRLAEQTRHPALGIALAHLLLVTGARKQARDVLSGTEFHRVDDTELNLSALRSCNSVGLHDAAHDLACKLLAFGELPEKQVARVARLRDEASYYLAGSRMASIATWDEFSEPSGFVLVYDVADPWTCGITTPIARQLRQAGYAVAGMTAGRLPSPKTGQHDFDLLGGCIVSNGTSFVDEGNEPHRLRNDWRIDWENRIVEADGINFFPYFHERVATQARKYTATIHGDPVSATNFELLLQRSDVALSFCKRLLPLANLGKPIRIVGMHSHFAPIGIFREWCAQIGRKYGIHFVAMGIGYENYYSNLSTLVSTTLTVEDLTAQPELRHPSMGGRRRFEQFLNQSPAAATVDAEVLGWVRQNRSRVAEQPSEYKIGVKELVDERRRKGGKVFAAFGNVLIDFAIPGDRGFAHRDFQEWITHLVEAVGGTENLLLIKPHPHEKRPEIVMDKGAQLLREILPDALPDNVVFLDHDAFNSYELAELVDVGFAWKGSVTVEFPLLGRLLVPGSVWSARDYPLDQPVLTSKAEYQAVLDGTRELELPPELPGRAAAFLRFMRSDIVAIPFRYVHRQASNQSVGWPFIYEQDYKKLVAEGDPHVDRAAARIFEFAEPSVAESGRRKDGRAAPAKAVGTVKQT